MNVRVSLIILRPIQPTHASSHPLAGQHVWPEHDVAGHPARKHPALRFVMRARGKERGIRELAVIVGIVQGTGQGFFDLPRKCKL